MMKAFLLKLERAALRFYNQTRRVGLRFASSRLWYPEIEPFAEAFYYLSHLPKESVILDVGANRGQFARAVRFWRPQSSIHCIEPLEDLTKKLKEEFSLDQKISIHCLALSDENGEARFFRTPSSEGSSLHRPSATILNAFSQFQGSQEIVVKKQTLDSFLNAHQIDACDLMKLDVQGHELHILKTLDTCKDRIRAILIELSFEHLYENDALYNEVIEQLRLLGFEIQAFTSFIHHPQSGRLLQADGLFLNSQFKIQRNRF